MLIEEIKNIKSSKKDLRQFGLTVGIAFCLLGLLLLWRKKEYYSYFFIISATLVSFGLFFPTLLKPIQKAWMTLAVILGWIVTRIILIILFYLVVTPIGILSRLFGKDLLNLKLDKKANSYWIKKTKETDKARYQNQF